MKAINDLIGCLASDEMACVLNMLLKIGAGQDYDRSQYSEKQRREASHAANLLVGASRSVLQAIGVMIKADLDGMLDEPEV